MAARYRFERFELHADERELLRDGKSVPLQELPLRLLAALVEQAPSTVSRETLRDALWPPGTLELDPTSPVFNTGFAWTLFLARHDDEAVAQAHHAIELQPDYYDAWDNLKWIEITLGHEAAALDAWVRAEEIDSGGGAGVLRAYAKGGLENLHRESIKSLTARWEAGGYQSPYDVVLEHAALGEVEEAMTWLERSFAERETDLCTLAVDPRVDVLREEPRFRDLLGEIDLPLPRRQEGSDGM